MNTKMNKVIDGVSLVKLKVIEDQRGAVLHMLRSDSQLFDEFGEIYFSQINPGIVKAWKRHQSMTQKITVPMGLVKFVVYDDRLESPTRGNVVEYTLGRPDSYNLLIIPPRLWYGFKGISREPSLVANCPNIPHDPGESENVSLENFQLKYTW